ncbi:MAG: ATP-binding protein [Prevotella sp.]
MEALNSIFLYTVNTQSYTYFVVLAVAALVMTYLVVSLWLLNKDKVMLSHSVDHLASMKQRGVEYELVLQAMKLATWKIDLREMTLTFDNDYRTSSNLYTPAPNTPLKDLIKEMMPEDAIKLKQAVEEASKGLHDIYHLQYRIKDATGNYYWSDAYGTISERDANGRPTMLVGTAKNISKQKQIEQDLINARLKAEESDRLKTAFIQNISHEVRTPLNAIVGFSDILTSVTDEQERNSLIAIIKENNTKLLQIFEDMMNISKVEAHDEKANLTSTRFDLVALVEEKVAKSRMKNFSANLTIDFVCQEQKLELVTNKERVEYIASHFLENALKFTSEGNITVGINVKADNQVRIWVSDTGKGIAPEDLEKIFDRFYKVDSFIQGAGLGLAVCRSYALSLGGNVGVDSQLGSGSTFWVEIPRKL